MAVVDGSEVCGKNEGHDGLQLHHDVQSRTRGVLEGVADGVALHRSVVGLLGLWSSLNLLSSLRVLGVSQLRVIGEAVLDELLAVVPGAARVGHGDGELHGGAQGAREEPEDGLDAEEGAGQKRREDHEAGRCHHLVEGGLRGDVDAGQRIRLQLIAAVQEGLALGVLDAELPLHFCDHFSRGLADGLHGERGEPVGDHAADDEEGEGDGLQDVDAGLHAQAHDKGTVEGQGDQGGGADGEALADGGCRVAGGIQSVRATANLGTEKCHLCDAARVVRDRPKAINGEATGERGEHAQSCQSDAVEVAELKGHVDGRGQHEDRHDAALVAQGQALDNVHGGAELARGGQLTRGHVAVGGEILRDQTDDEAAHAAHGGTDEALVRASGDLGLLPILSQAHTLQAELRREQDNRKVVDHWQHQDGGEHHLHLQHSLDVGFFLDRRDVGGHKATEDADHNAGSRDGQREEHGIPAGIRQRVVRAFHSGGCDDQCSAGALGEGAEKIRAHAGDVAHVVADVVRDCGGVVGIVLIQAGNDLANQVRTDVGGLGVDTTADTAEHGNGAATQAIAGRTVEEDLPVVSLWEDGAVEAQQHPEDQNTQGAESIAHDAAATEGRVEAQGVAAVGTGQSGAGVGVGGHHHAQEAAEHRGEGSCQEGAGSEVTLQGALGTPGHQRADQDGEGQAESRANGVLHLQKLDGAIHNLRIDLRDQLQSLLAATSCEAGTQAVLGVRSEADLPDDQELRQRGHKA
mmetsp:Transcript_15687/g.37040  ORF Transcript_15687/g.37040 Transcript_15687/m.37040 type:complete len:747 (-) Transcript_15687:115-2355(-)